MTHTRLLLLTTALLAPLSAARAQEVTVLPPIIVSGGLTPAPADAYGRAHTVLSREEIEARGVTTLQDALRGVPGVAVSSSGPSSTQIRIRGAEANHTLILVDGVEVSGGSPADYFLSGLSVQNIERVEVLRGPQSVFYGSSASAGVVNIITDKGAEGLHYGGSAEVGNGHSASAHVSQRSVQGGLSLNLSQLDDHGFDYSGDGGEKDGLRRNTIGLAGDWKATDTLTFGSTLRWTKEEYEYDSFGPSTGEADLIVDDKTPEGETREFQGALFGELSTLGGRLTHRLDYQRSVFKLDTFESDLTRAESDTLKYRLSYGLDGLPVDQARHLLNVLVEHEDDDSNVATDYERERESVALEYRASLDNGLDLQAGVRRDDNKVFDDFTGWTLGLSWRIPGQPVRLHASAGRAQVDPSYAELFGSASAIGNPDLIPEQNRSYDLGAEFTFLNGRALVDVTYFHEQLTNEITNLYILVAPETYRAFAFNADGESPREGIEVTGKLQATDALDLSFGYTYLDAQGPDGRIEVRRPKHELQLSSTLFFLQDRASATATVRHVAGNYDDQFYGAYERAELPNYTTLDLAAGYDLTKEVRLTGRVTNLFDESYSDVWGYATRGRQAYVGVQARW
ncbi:TonB-dependent receptor plug domain-containing protein [Falsirhodobacter sp. 20TX0035]|uniref:TonB-dependent receptor plug domain-containing protein n=1 Tax=Falsirhodobacter sp. 20TX0035 TaxID=3022019 RepID=UPI00232AA516|nr:TonB-dependent receptor [Falsirhodobacter sp. 20TX0035]MDB6452896.1 TonB-dependent receptor [Falsirhodobacter sp. 20TX0035]